MNLNKPITFETTFATYTATKILGEGGAGRVYHASDELGNVYAVKLLDPARATKEKLKRFKNEVLFGSRNQHQNIIRVNDHGIYSEGKKSAPFYIMPLCEGSLRTLLANRIVPDKVLFYFSQLLDGVEAAHFQRVVHRDLKPENVLYDAATDRLLVADFGIAHFEEEELYTAVETKSNDRLANFQYAAPEQRSRGMSVDQRADIYALGLILNELFTAQILQGTGYTTIGSVAPNYAYLDEVVDGMVRQFAEERYASIDIVKQRLIAHRNDFISRQRLSELTRIVIPQADIDDPLINNPIRVVDVDYKNSNLIFILSSAVNSRWKNAFETIENYTYIPGYYDPRRFELRERQAIIQLPSHVEVDQQMVDLLKDYVYKANERYKEFLTNEQRQKEVVERKRLQEEIEDEKKRQKLRHNLKV